MLPGCAAGRIDERGWRDKKADAAAYARVPRRLRRYPVAALETSKALVGEGAASEGRSLFGEADIALDTEHPSGRHLPIITRIGTGTKRDAIEWLAGCREGLDGSGWQKRATT